MLESELAFEQALAYLVFEKKAIFAFEVRHSQLTSVLHWHEEPDTRKDIHIKEKKKTFLPTDEENTSLNVLMEAQTLDKYWHLNWTKILKVVCLEINRWQSWKQIVNSQTKNEKVKQKLLVSNCQWISSVFMLWILESGNQMERGYFVLVDNWRMDFKYRKVWVILCQGMYHIDVNEEKLNPSIRFFSSLL